MPKGKEMREGKIDGPSYFSCSARDDAPLKIGSVNRLTRAEQFWVPKVSGEGLDRDDFEFGIDLLFQHSFDSHQRSGE